MEPPQENILTQFTATVSGQVGTAVISASGIKWRAAGSVASFWELKGSDTKKFQVSNKAPKFLFERADGKKFTMQVVLNEDEKCGISEQDISQRERVKLEEVRAVIRNQKHWAMNNTVSATGISASTSSTTKESAKTSSKPISGGWNARGANPNSVKDQGTMGSNKRPRPVQSEQEREEESIKEDLLASDKDLNDQFRELVVENQVISEQDFWHARKHLISTEVAKRAGNNESLESWWWRKISREWAEVSESKKFRLSLKNDDKFKIFTLFPEVCKLFEQKVPHEVSEVEFWTNFFKSEFLHLGRKASANQGTSLSAGMFASVGNSDEITPKTPEEVNNLTSKVDPSVDLVSTFGDYTTDPTMVDVYTPMVARQSDVPSDVEIRDSSERASVINRYNHHAQKLLHPPLCLSRDPSIMVEERVVPFQSSRMHKEIPLNITPSSTSVGEEQMQDDVGSISYGSMLQGNTPTSYVCDIHLRDFALELASRTDSGLRVYDTSDVHSTQKVHELLRHLFVTITSNKDSAKFEEWPFESQRKVRALEQRMNKVREDLRSKLVACLQTNKSPAVLRYLEGQLVTGLEAIEKLSNITQNKKRGFVEVVDSPRANR